MQSIMLSSRVGQDGVLKLSVPVGLPDMEMEVMIIIQPVTQPGWPPAFFEHTFGCLRGEPLVRESQGEYEIRDELQ
jgi:hypothetical protein